MPIRISLCLLLTIMILFSVVSQPTTTSAQRFDLIIKNGLIIDGSGRPGYRADLAVSGDRIVRIGNLKTAKAAREFDAKGMVVAPGFIDML